MATGMLPTKACGILIFILCSLLVAGLDNVKETMREKQRFAHVLQGMKGMESHPLRDEYPLTSSTFLYTN